MGVLVLVRHGQASLLEEVYDKLSPLGEKQARSLGEYWAARKFPVTHVFSGPCVRQIRTAEIVGDSYREAGLAWPEPIALTGLDEYQAELVLKQSLHALSERHDHIRSLRELFHQSEDRVDKIRNFQKLFEVVITMWIRGEYETPGLEGWSDFVTRVRQSITTMTVGEGKGRRVVAFTSGGPIAVAMQLALETSEQKTLQLSWMLRNGSFSEFLFSGERFTLSCFNAVPHLDEAGLWTYW